MALTMYQKPWALTRNKDIYKTMTKMIDGLRDIIDFYDTFVIDQWGVLHDGFNPLEGAPDALANLRQAGKTIVILSNSGKRATDSMQNMKKLGYTPDMYDHMVTSGEQLHYGLKNQHDPFYQNIGRRARLFTYADNYNIVADLPQYTVVDHTRDADFIIASGIRGNDLSIYADELNIALQQDLPLLVANPDKVSIRPDGTMQLCPGTLGELYESMGGTIRINGKPTLDIYTIVCNLIGGQWGRAIGIGDSLAHDIRGAENAGLDSWFICQGIHRHDTELPPIPAKVTTIAEQYGVSPTYASSYFAP